MPGEFGQQPPGMSVPNTDHAVSTARRNGFRMFTDKFYIENPALMSQQGMEFFLGLQIPDANRPIIPGGDEQLLVRNGRKVQCINSTSCVPAQFADQLACRQ